MIVSFIDEYRVQYGVEPIGAPLPIAPSVYYPHKAERASPERRAPRARRDATLSAELQRVQTQTFQVYAARQVGRPLNREGSAVARCRVERLRQALGLQGVQRGKRCRTTVAEVAADRPADRVNRPVTASRPKQLWGADFTAVATWVGVVYVAVVIDLFARRRVGWRVARSMSTARVRDALEQAWWSRAAPRGRGPHSARGRHYLSRRYWPRLAEAGLAPSVGSVGESYDNALAEPIIGRYKAEVIHHRGPWRNLAAVEYATLEGGDGYNPRRRLTSIGDIPPAEKELAYHRQERESASGA